MKVHTQIKCIIDDGKFSWAMLFTRLIVCCAALYFISGLLLNFRAVTDSTSLLLTLSVHPAFVVAFCLIGIAACISIFFGIGTKWGALFLIVFNLTGGFVFTGSETNKIFIYFVMLSIASLLPLLMLGPGRYSLDFKKVMQESENFLTK